jgi:uncharacterized protein YgiM (DUF1202 family)
MKRLCLAFVATLTTAAAQAEPMFVSDKLVVNVYAEADQESSKVTTLDSGDAVEVIEKADVFSHVRLPDNREGWIKSSYLSSQVPAIVRLKELEKERNASASAPTAQVTEELKRLKEQNTALQSQLATAKTAAAQAPAPVVTVAPSVPQSLQTGTATAGTSSPPNVPGFTRGAVIALSGGLIGFLLGYQALARRIRRKYGSVRIY